MSGHNDIESPSPETVSMTISGNSHDNIMSNFSGSVNTNGGGININLIDNEESEPQSNPCQHESETHSDPCQQNEEETCDMCNISRQSPVNLITKNINRTHIPNSILDIHYNNKSFTYKSKDNKAGNFIPSSDNNFVLHNGIRYNLAQFHYHIRSDHTIDGKEFNAEVHLVHINPNYNNEITVTENEGVKIKSIDSNQYLVIGLLLSQEHSNTDLFKGVFDIIHEDNQDELTIDFGDLKKLSYFYFPGSLTASPFTSTITWFVSDNIIHTNMNLPNEPNELFPWAHPTIPIQRHVRDTALYLVPNTSSEHQ